MSTDSTPDFRTIIIGDVHGHYDGLMTLVAFLETTAEDKLFFLGDLVDRGPKSCQVVEFVKSQGHRCLRGNHEELMITACNPDNQDYLAFQLWSSCGGSATLASYKSPQLLREHVAWFKTLPTYIDLGSLWLVHAGVHPEMPIEEQTSEEFCWIRQEFHQMTKPFFPDKQIITGHTITFTFPKVEPGQVVQGPGWLDIDTGAYHPKSGWLTAYDVNQEKIYQVNVHTDEARVRGLDEAIVPMSSRRRQLRFA